MSFADELAAARRSAARVGAAHHVGEAVRALKRAQAALAKDDCMSHGSDVAAIVLAVEAVDATGSATDVGAMITVLETVFADIEAAWQRAAHSLG